jgi:cell division septum initiation protein DivIVA
MASPSERSGSSSDEAPDGLPRTEVDLEASLESLREFVVRGGMTPMGHRLWLDLEEFEERIEQVISLLPKEIRRARRITREEQRIIQDAKDEARRILDEARAEADQISKGARESAEQMIESSAIRQRALEQAETIIANAEETAGQIRQKSYTYAQQVVSNVEASLKRLAQSVEQDKVQLDANKPDNV